MKFSARFLEDAANAIPEERATVADLQIFVSEQNVTMHLRDNSTRTGLPTDHVTIPLYNLAEGIAYDWWSLFGGRDQEFRLMKYRSGFLVPDVRFKFDGVAFEVSAPQKVYKNPDVRFWAGPTEVLSRPQAEFALSDIVQQVIQQLDRKKFRESSAALRWARVQESRERPEEAAFCESAGALGLDPYQIADADALTIDRASSLFEDREALDEFLSGARPYTPNQMLDWIVQAEKRPKYKSTLPGLRDLVTEAEKITPSHSIESSWALGYRRARAMRKALNLANEKRIRSSKQLASMLGASESYSPAGTVNGIRAIRHDYDGHISIHLRNHGKSATQARSEMFSFARAIGDAACFPNSGRSAINELHSAYRQAAGRAFAAEFLAPIEEIKSMQKDGWDRISIEDEFCVSAHVIEHQIENADRINLACAA
ncbi:hypothetical protein [Bradyrhizobium sp. SZCCHNRI3052]|uniref:ImmA/IrrE family metallo-endopeptidase n=1 Tax=Bradyrhizobium sp. SZCCHNRI3052 TaxID=3057295 RepID=UPI00291693C6|nr:hypothetical protein [Bradyrhizobium sp. SZCCHNRI3052]